MNYLNLFTILNLLHLVACLVKFRPEAVHLAYGNDIQEYVVTWSTRQSTEVSICEYGIGGFILSANGNSTLFIDGGNEKRSQYIHRVWLKNLKPSSKYVYHCGSNFGWSNAFYFWTAPTGSEPFTPHIVIFGDMGNENAQSLSRLQDETQKGLYDAAVHVGDIAYDLHTDNAEVGDEFMNQIEGIAAYVPYMTVPGNHEEIYNFSNYRARFTMPGNTEGLWYSFNVGPVHFIALDTEVYYFMNYGIKQMIKQFEWLEKDLQEANSLKNRAQRPWIVTFGHRPMYCSNANTADCTGHESLVRVGLPFFNWFGLEDLFFKYKVDLEFWAHEHSYERLLPLYNFTVRTDNATEPYTNYKAPVHIITGSAGCNEGVSPFIPKRPNWSVFSSSDYGYTRMKVHNKTHLFVEQVSDVKNGEIIDSV